MSSGWTKVVVMIFVAGLATSACRSNDLGTPCELVRPVCVANCNDPENMQIEYEPFQPEDLTRDYIATGVIDCEHFTCVSSQGHQEQAYCTRTCLADDQCTGGTRDLVCRELLLDRDFIARLCESIGDEECERIFGRIQDSSFCAVPLDPEFVAK